MLENLKLSERDIQDLRELIPLTILKDEGEDAVFRYIREQVL